MAQDERFWRRRLVWRLRGGLQWPAFVLFTLLDAVVLWRLPPLATRDLTVFDGAFMAIFGNLVLLGAVAPFLARRMARRRAVATAGAPMAQAEREVLQDRIAAILLAVGFAGCLISGLGNRPVIVSETNETEEAGRQLELFVRRSGSAELRRNFEAANTHRIEPGYFRLCVPRDDRRRNVCILVDTRADPISVRRDPSGSSNQELFGLDDR